MQDLVRIPPAWMHEARQAYEQYCLEWDKEELERVAGTDERPEPAEPWNKFFSEYLYAELENSVYVGTVNSQCTADSE